MTLITTKTPLKNKVAPYVIHCQSDTYELDIMSMNLEGLALGILLVQPGEFPLVVLDDELTSCQSRQTIGNLLTRQRAAEAEQPLLNLFPARYYELK